MLIPILLFLIPIIRSSDYELTAEDLQFVLEATSDAAPRRTNERIIFLEELLRDFSISTDAVMARIHSVIPDSHFTPDMIKRYRSDIKRFFAVPVWVHNFMQVNGQSFDRADCARLANDMLKHPQCEAIDVWVTPERMYVVAFIWATYCIIPLRWGGTAACRLQSTMVKGRLVEGWVLSRSQMRRFLENELSFLKSH